jgi:SAM-dependent methyltransferase
MPAEINEKRTTHQIAVAYGDDYLSWKNWGGEKFGKLRKTDKAYYGAEIKRIRSTIERNSKVLEIGFGNGGFLRFARERGWVVLGTEVNEDLVKAAKEQGYDAFKSEDLSVFDDNKFDLVVAFDVIEHIPQDELSKFFVEVRRILRDKGHFIARVPNGDSPFGLPYQNGDLTHVTTIGSGKAAYFAQKSNMEVVFLGGEAQPIVGTSFVHFVHRIVAVPTKRFINFFVKNIYFPRSNVDFCASNLTLIYRVRK